MDLEQIEALLKLLSENDVSEFSFKNEAISLKLRLGPPPPIGVAAAPAPVPAAPSLVPALAVAPAPVADPDAGLHIVESPMVGTFYCAPSPGAPSFVEVGARVEKGAVLCIIEAMKLMNEIESDVSGVVVEVLAENAQPVQFGQAMFKIRPG